MRHNAPVAAEARRAADRFRTERPGSTTWHSFSFGDHYDPANTGFGPVVAVNDENLPAGGGFDEHEHRGLVIVTYVVEGRLGILEAGDVGVFRTGTGAAHTERAEHGPVRFVQTWITTSDPTVSYEVADGPVVVDDWQFRVGHGEVEVQEAHVFVVPSGDAVRITPPGDRVTGDTLLVTERVLR